VEQKVMSDQTTAAQQRGPVSPPLEVGISSNVLRELPKINPAIAARIKEHIDRKG
jgi:hypothetical protein